MAVSQAIGKTTSPIRAPYQPQDLEAFASIFSLLLETLRVFTVPRGLVACATPPYLVTRLPHIFWLHRLFSQFSLPLLYIGKKSQNRDSVKLFFDLFETESRKIWFFTFASWFFSQILGCFSCLFLVPNFWKNFSIPNMSFPEAWSLSEALLDRWEDHSMFPKK